MWYHVPVYQSSGWYGQTPKMTQSGCPFLFLYSAPRVGLAPRAKFGPNEIDSSKRALFSGGRCVKANEDTHTISDKKIYSRVCRFQWCRPTYRACINSQGEWPLAQISRTCHYSTLNISEAIQDRHFLTTWPIELCHRQYPWSTFRYIISAILSENKFSILFRSLIEDRAILRRMTLSSEWPLKIISDTANSFIVYISQRQHYMLSLWDATVARRQTGR